MWGVDECETNESSVSRVSLSLPVCECVCVPFSFSCAHSTGQRTESTGTDPSRWSSSLPTWRRTSSAEYFGSTTQRGWGDTPGSKRKLFVQNKCSSSAPLPIICNFCDLFVFPAVITTANLFCDCTPHTSHPDAGLSIQAVLKQSFCSLTMPLLSDCSQVWSPQVAAFRQLAKMFTCS